MADLFLSYARPDQARVADIANAAQKGGRKIWWDRQLFPGDDYAMIIEREIDASRCVLVAWSQAARDSLWVRAEANAALDQGKLVQVSLGPTRLPLPFTMLQVTDIGAWGGAVYQEPWPDVAQRIGAQIDDARVLLPEGMRQPEPGGVPLAPREEQPLQGLGSAAIIGWVALAAVAIVALAAVGAARGVIGAGLFTPLAFGALALAILLLVTAAWLLIRVEKASRR